LSLGELAGEQYLQQLILFFFREVRARSHLGLDFLAQPRVLHRSQEGMQPVAVARRHGLFEDLGHVCLELHERFGCAADAPAGSNRSARATTEGLRRADAAGRG